MDYFLYMNNFFSSKGAISYNAYAKTNNIVQNALLFNHLKYCNLTFFNSN